MRRRTLVTLPDHDRDMYKLGYEAAANGEKRTWCAEFGSYCLMGWDDYWTEFGP